MLYRCIQTSPEVRAVTLRSPLFSFVAEWSSGDRFQDIQWSATPAPNTIYLSVNLENQAVFEEIFDQAEWGTLYYAMQTVSDSNLPSFFFSLTVYDAGERS
jgi:hypothetical protein